MSRKILIVTGNGGDGYEALYASQRFQEARWEPVLAAPSRRRLYLVFHDVEPDWETYVEWPGPSLEADVVITTAAAREFAALLILGGTRARISAQRCQPAFPGAGVRRTAAISPSAMESSC